MNDIRTFTIDEFNKQMRQPTLHPEVAVIDPARLEDDGTLRATSTPSALSRHDAAKRVMAESAPISNMARWYLRSRATSCASAGRMPWTEAYPVFCSTRSCSAPKALCSRKPTIRSSITGRTSLCTFPCKRSASCKTVWNISTRNCGAILTATAYALYLPGWNCCWTTAFVSMNGNLPAAPTLTGNIWRSWTKRFPNIFHYADKSLWKAV